MSAAEAEKRFTNQKDVDELVASWRPREPTFRPKPKVDPSTADRLVTQAQGVIDCINAIGADV